MAVDTQLIRDVVVVVPGIMGSALAGPGGDMLWDVRPGSLPQAVRALANDRLRLPPGVGDGPAPDRVRATRLLSSLHVIPGLWSPVTGYDGLLDFLRSPRFQFIEPDAAEPDLIPNLLTFPYDWRLSCRYNGAQLAQLALPALQRWREQPGMQDAKLVLVCHSMGGLVGRWFAACEGGAPLIRALLTLGTPHRGAVRALGTLVNGLEPGLGPLRLSLTALTRSLPSMHDLLPQYDCLVAPDGSRSRLDPSQCPGVDAALWRSASDFHARIASPQAPAYPLYKVVGIRQPTPTTAAWKGDRLDLMEGIDGQNDGGDGTVPRLAAEPALHRGMEVVTVAEQHGELQDKRAVWDLLDGLLTREQVVWQGAGLGGDAIGVRMADVWTTAQSPSLQLDPVPDALVTVEVLNEAGQVVRPAQLVPPSGALVLAPLPEGAWRIRIRGRHETPRPVHKPILVLAGA